MLTVFVSVFFQFDLSKFTVGAVFVLNGGVYALTAPGLAFILFMALNSNADYV